MTAWPTDVPTSPQINTLTGNPDDAVLRSQFDAGQPTTRARYTAIADSYQLTLLMSLAQFTVFKAFYKDNRALPFDFPDPVTGATRAFKFRGPYTLNSIEAIDYYMVNISIVSPAE